MFLIKYVRLFPVAVFHFLIMIFRVLALFIETGLSARNCFFFVRKHFRFTKG